MSDRRGEEVCGYAAKPQRCCAPCERAVWGRGVTRVRAERRRGRRKKAHQGAGDLVRDVGDANVKVRQLYSEEVALNDL